MVILSDMDHNCIIKQYCFIIKWVLSGQIIIAINRIIPHKYHQKTHDKSRGPIHTDIITCPQCHLIVDGSIMVNDGGSKFCSNCRCKFHLCGGRYKIGSPGPSMCEDCKKTRLNG